MSEALKPARPSSRATSGRVHPIVRLLWRDVRGAKRNDWNNCPIARALNRLHPGNQFAVYDEHIQVNGYNIDHTEETAAFTQGWNDGPMRPEVLRMPMFEHHLKHNAEVCRPARRETQTKE